MKYDSASNERTAKAGGWAQKTQSTFKLALVYQYKVLLWQPEHRALFCRNCPPKAHASSRNFCIMVLDPDSYRDWMPRDYSTSRMFTLSQNSIEKNKWSKLVFSSNTWSTYTNSVCECRIKIYWEIVDFRGRKRSHICRYGEWMNDSVLQKFRRWSRKSEWTETWCFGSVANDENWQLITTLWGNLQLN